MLKENGENLRKLLGLAVFVATLTVRPLERNDVINIYLACTGLHWLLIHQNKAGSKDR
jgi:hypothetical protein